MKLLRLSILVLTLAAAFGCSRQIPNAPLKGVEHLGAPGDTLPPGAPGDTLGAPGDTLPPPPVEIVPIEYFGGVGSDTLQAGHLAYMRWKLGNTSDHLFYTHWTLTSANGWPGFPLEAIADIPAHSTIGLETPVTPPAGTPPGSYSFTMVMEVPEGGTVSRTVAIWVH